MKGKEGKMNTSRAKVKLKLVKSQTHKKSTAAMEINNEKPLQMAHTFAQLSIQLQLNI